MNRQDAQALFTQAVEHIWVAYRFFNACLPSAEQFAHGRVLRVGKFEFKTENQVKSMQVELSWAFFTRLEAAFEALTLRLNLDAKAVYERLLASECFVGHEIEGLKVARELRNILHHGDGDPALLRNRPTLIQVDNGHEPHLQEEHMERYVELFRKAAIILTSPESPVVH